MFLKMCSWWTYAVTGSLYENTYGYSNSASDYYETKDSTTDRGEAFTTQEGKNKNRTTRFRADF